MENADSVRVKECATRLFLFLITVFGQCQNRRRNSFFFFFFFFEKKTCELSLKNKLVIMDYQNIIKL